MSEVGRSWRALVFGMMALLLALPAPGSAHETRKVDRLHLTIGWGDEPTFTGSRNSVEVDVSDAAGKPVTDRGSSEPGSFRLDRAPTRSTSPET